MKASMEFHHNSAMFERGTLRKLILMCIPQMDRVRMTEFVGPTAEMRRLGQRWVIGKTLRFKGLKHCAGAIVFFGAAGHHAAEIQALGVNNHTTLTLTSILTITLTHTLTPIQACALVGGQPFLVVDLLGFVGRAACSSRWTRTGRFTCVAPDGARPAVAHYNCGDGSLNVLH